MGSVESTPEENEQIVLTLLQHFLPRLTKTGSKVFRETLEPVVQRAVCNEEERIESSTISRLRSGRGGGSDGVEDFIEAAVANDVEGERRREKFHFETMDFGDKAPKISEICIHPRDEDDPDKMIVDFKLEYDGNCDVSVSLFGIRGGIREMKFSSRARVVINPMVDAFPFVGGFRFCLLDEPKIGFDMGGIANIADWPRLGRKVRSEIIEETAQRIVFPNSICVSTSLLDDEDSDEPRKSPKFIDISGILFVKPLRACDLPKKGGVRSLLGQGKPDPYVIASLGANHFVTEVEKNTTEPTWEGSDEWFCYPLDTLKGHKLRLRLYDEDTLTRDEFLGKAELMVEELASNPEGEPMELQLNPDSDEKTKYDEITGSVTFQAIWRPLLNGSPSDEGQFGKIGVFSIFVHECRNIAAGGDEKPTSRLLIRLGQSGILHKSNWKRKNRFPKFEFGSDFPVSAGDIESGIPVVLTVIDKQGSALLSAEIPVTEFIENSWNSNDFVSDPDSNQTFKISAALKFI